MASSIRRQYCHGFSILILLLGLATPVLAQCQQSERHARCHDKAKALKLKLVAISTILVMSMLGVCLPLFSRAVPALKPDRDVFLVVKCFSSGVILATGYMHVLPDSWDDLKSKCLPDEPWHKFPFTTFVAMLSAVVTLMVDSLWMSWHRKRSYSKKAVVAGENGTGGRVLDDVIDGTTKEENIIASNELQRHRMVAQVLEMGIIVHSVIIGLAMGASHNPCTIGPLIAALCFHQFFEGMGLGGCILQAEYGLRIKAMMSLFFSVTTPLGIALGIGLSKVYSERSRKALIVEGLLNACSAGLLNYMALVDLLAADFLGPKLQANIKLQLWSFLCVFLGAGFMALMAKWA